MSMSEEKITLPHKCPKCEKEAKTYQELYEKFDFRNMNSNSMRNQSWCRECRSSK
jgi:predicted  nucleic acid-binding Zn ribbon protein